MPASTPPRARALDSRPPGSTRRRGRAAAPASGFTLVEVMVALVILALGLALVAPGLASGGDAADPLDAVVLGARSAAIRRGQHLTLTVDGGDHWRLDAPDGTSAGEGAVTTGAGGLRLRLSPLGACVLEEGPSALAAAWDAARCGAGGAEGGPR